MKWLHGDSPYRVLLITLAVGLAYILAGKLGQSMAIPPGNVTPFWPPSAIALAAVMLLGRASWPGILLGAALVNISLDFVSVAALLINLMVALGIGVGSLLQPVFGAFLLRRLGGEKDPFAKPVSTLRFALIVPLMCLVSASVGASSLYLGGLIAAEGFPEQWLTWWLGDSVGVIVFLPLLLAWSGYSASLSIGAQPRRRLEFAALLVLTVVASLFVFRLFAGPQEAAYPLEYLTVPLMLWAALRFGLKGATAAILLVSVVASWSTAHGVGPFSVGIVNHSLLLLQLFVGLLNITVLVVCAADTERRTTGRALEDQAQIKRARQAAEEANRAKSAFLANMSHELRTPMNAILGYSEMLIEEAEDAGQDDFIPDLKKINQAGNHLLSLINDVLDLSKIESGKMEAFAEQLDVGALVDQVYGTAQPLMTKNNNHFTIERSEDLGKAYQDVTKLRQALLNLLSNAAKFTHEGTITLRAEHDAPADGEWLTFSVSDTGIGIPADKLEHVFEEFSQADNSTTRDYGGTGLGLPISRRFCQMLGGDLTVSSSAGEGSTFTMRIPALLPGTEAQTPAQTAPATTDAELEAIRGSGAGRTVLVIDDDPEARDIVERFLRKDGFEVTTAGSGEEGLHLAHELKPAAITLDVMMPETDGWSVLRALKADPVLQDVPVVMLTMMDDKSKGYSLGATDYLTKPVDRNQLHHALARYYAPGQPCSVLLVEDDKATREMMARTLEKAEWAVSEAGNGREALEQMAQTKPRLILLDLMMPVMDGFDFLLEMRAKTEWRDIPVIVLTAKDLTDEDRRLLSGRVEQIVEKGTCAHEQVVDLVHKVLDDPTPDISKAAALAQSPDHPRSGTRF